MVIFGIFFENVTKFQNSYEQPIVPHFEVVNNFEQDLTDFPSFGVKKSFLGNY